MALKPHAPLSRLKDSSRGPIHHIEIHTAKNAKGKRGFITRTFRKPTRAALAEGQKTGRYVPEATPDQDTVHPDAASMMAHVGKSYGMAQADDGDGPDAEPDDDEEGE